MRLALIFLTLAFFARAAVAVEPYTCRNGFFPSHAGKIGAGEIVAAVGEQVFFRDDAGGCPEAQSCRRKSYVVNKDKLLLAQTDGGWVCAWFTGRRGETVGWLPADKVKPAAASDAVPGAQDWIGKWVGVMGGEEIRIRADGKGGLIAQGAAEWHGGRAADGFEVVHTGEFDEAAIPRGNLLQVGDEKEEYACVVRMQRVGDSLVATDNTYCGGVNVRFDDVYVRAGSRR
ncbi:MAG: hypothetical protein GAK35_01848 [Herbaspirillum frisingense]|uniref:SH3 domain-containing protein n=1 Tax=Herbaspirillum frisingense TaxID=92645 RepID=A0A7V8JUE8_9BURK|nr:MAG: hypothetical protein GAK35_01848 [Herbaspirillum frisingense]